jgi:PIN domain nuclease of toxin-antitoxin system
MSGEELKQDSRRTIDAAVQTQDAFVSPISAWEIGILVRKRKLALSLSPEAWFEAMLTTGLRLAPMSVRTLIASSFLPEPQPTDPADRILAATARDENLVLITRDAHLLAYSKEGNLRALPC